MSTAATNTRSARLPSDIAQEIARTAREDDRTQNGQLVHLLRIGLAGRQRLAELDRLAVEEIASANRPSSASDAGAAHLAEHSRLCGFQPNSELHHPEGEKP